MEKETHSNHFREIVARHFPAAELVAYHRLTGGVSADVYRLDLIEAGRQRAVVIRIHGDTHGRHEARIEFDLLCSLHRAGVPVAEPIALDTVGDLVKDPCLLMAFVDGTTLVPKGQENKAIALMADALASLHANLPEGLPDLPARLDPLPEVFDFMPEGSEWQALIDHLKTMQDTAFDDMPVFLHGDYWPENILWKDGRIAAILDFEDSAIGDPLSDVACCRLELRYVYGVELAEQFTRRYEKHAAVDRSRLALWDVYVAAAAQKFMGMWNLPAEKEAHMRGEALQSIREAGVRLMS